MYKSRGRQMLALSLKKSSKQSNVPAADGQTNTNDDDEELRGRQMHLKLNRNKNKKKSKATTALEQTNNNDKEPMVTDSEVESCARNLDEGARELLLQMDTQGLPICGTYKKPYRYCIFCKKMWSKLRVHIEKMHNGHERVCQALKMGKRERDSEFDAFRKEGILKLNKIRLKKNPENPKLERERRNDTNENGKLVMCHLCKAFIEKRYISRHEKKHGETSDDRDHIYKHLWHSEDVNKNVYEAPVAVKALSVVGKRSQALDKGEDQGTHLPAGPAVGVKTQQEEDDCLAHSGRGYTHWNTARQKVICDYFEAYLLGETTKKLPGKKEVQQFLSEHQDFKVKNFIVIRSKVMNEKSKRERLVKKMESSQ